MSTTLEKFQELKRRADKLQQQKNKAEGALENQLAQLKKDFGCDSIEEARKMLRSSQRAAVKAQAEFEEALREFEDEWGDKLQEMET